MPLQPTGRSVYRRSWAAVTAIMISFSLIFIFLVPAIPQSTEQLSPDDRQYLREIENTYLFVLRNYVDKPDAKKVFEGTLKGMMESLGDPYSVYLDSNMFSSMNDITSGEFGGIGLYIEKQGKEPRAAEDTPLYIEIISPIEDTPGWKAGLKPTDLIVKINGEDTAPLSVEEGQGKIRGPVGTMVTLTIKRGDAEPFNIELARARIEIPTVKYSIIPSQTGDIAYLRIIEFSAQTKARVEEAIAFFNKTGYKSMIIDVRNNPGGLLPSVIDVADDFLGRGTIVSTKGRYPAQNELFTADSSVLVPLDRPVVVLLNKGSASASEILAAALKDNKRAYLVGENTYGKGSVQQIFPLGSTGFKLTTARYYTPSDENIDKTGIPPDLEAKDPDLDRDQTSELVKLANSGQIQDWVKLHSNAAVGERNAFAAEIAAKNEKLPLFVLKRLVAFELQRTKIAPVYNLEFDVALRAAINILKQPDFPKLLANADSVRDMVEAKKAAQATTKASEAQVTAPQSQD